MSGHVFPRLHTPDATARPILAIDVTAVWDRPVSGIQRVARAITPNLADEAVRRGWDVQLVHHTRQGLASLCHWSSDTTTRRIENDLDRIAMGVRDGEHVAYARFRNALRRRIRALRAARRMQSQASKKDRWLRRLVPRWLQERVADWRHRKDPVEVMADAFITFSAGILPAKAPSGVPPERSVYVVHDLIPLRHPQYYSSELSRAFLANLGDLAMTPGLAHRKFATASRYVALDICGFFRGVAQTEVQVDVVNWGYDQRTFFPEPDGSFRHRYGIPKDVPLVVAVSTQDPRKRFGDIAAAVNRSGAHAVFLGTGSMRREGRALFLGHVPDDLVRRAFSSGDVSANWSAAEGFGLPTIEALACGARVVVPPDNPTLLEIGGANVTVAEQADVAGLCRAIERAARQPRRTPDLSVFTWQQPLRRFCELLWDEPAAVNEARAGGRPRYRGLAA